MWQKSAWPMTKMILATFAAFACRPVGGLAPASRASVKESFDWSWAMQPSLEAQAMLRPEEADPTALPASVLGADALSTRGAALEMACADAVRTVPAALSAEACAALRRFCDEEIEDQLDLDNTDGLPDFQVNVNFDAELAELVGEGDHASLRALPSVAFGADRDGFARVGCFIRRYTAAERPFMKWHVDGNAFTANVALSPPGDHDGGDLVAVYGSRCRSVPRALGEATIHRGGLCHGVRPLTRGERYSLILFFHDDRSLDERTSRDAALPAELAGS